jgi:1,2-diacylglycerol 3-alpha-glucosyltransferase
MHIVGVEACGAEGTYAWESVEGADAFTRLTLTARGEGSHEWRRRLASQMEKALNETRPDVVAVPGWSFTDALCGLGWCARIGIPAIVMSDSHGGGERRSWWKEEPKRRVVSLFSSALVAGRPHADYLIQLGMPRERIFLGYDAVDNGYFEDKAEESRNQKAESRNKFGLPERYFLASARFIEEKNLLRLIQAYARYRTLCEKSVLSGPVVPWSLVLLGDGPLRDSLSSQLSTLNLHGHVQMPGFKQYPDLPTYYGLASALILPSVSETWGLVVNEAMASGLPVLVSNRCGCVPDLVQDGVNGFTFDPLDVEALAQLMFKISAFQPFRLSAFGDASRTIISEWGPERFANGLKAAVDKALEVGPSKPTLLQRAILHLLLRR